MKKYIGRQKEFRSNLVKRRETKIILVLDNFQSAVHVAQVLRTAYAYGVDRVYLVGSTAQPPFGKELSALSDSAETKIDIRTSANTKKLIANYSAKGFISLAMTVNDDTQPIQDLELGDNVMIVMTDENQNISKEVVKSCDFAVSTTKFRKYSDAGIVSDLGVILYHLK
jgi:tRNA G18 (ribose-2'-O)-methylase SpoU